LQLSFAAWHVKLPALVYTPKRKPEACARLTSGAKPAGKSSGDGKSCPAADLRMAKQSSSVT